jgi:15-cis-phytoene synthase
VPWTRLPSRRRCQRARCPPDLSGDDEALADLVAFECARVHEWFERDRRSRACVCAMAGIYYRLLVHIERDPMAVTQRRLSLPAAAMVWIAGKCLVVKRP